MTLNVAGNMVAERVETGGAALILDVAGALSARDATNEVIAANATGALTTLRLGQSSEQSETGLRINATLLDATVAQGDLHLLETDGLRAFLLLQLTVRLTLGSRGTMDVGRVQGQTVVLTAAQDLVGNGATINADQINLFAFGGAITGSDGTFDVDTSDGAVLVLNAQSDVNLTERTGDLRIAVANAVAGDLSIASADPAGLLDVGTLGTSGTMRLTSAGDLALNVVGGGQIDLIDEVALNLIDRSDPRYGLTTLSTPNIIELTANGDDSNLSVRLAQLHDHAILKADTVTANLFDASPSDGLDLTVTTADGGFAQVDVRTVAAGFDGIISDPFGLSDVNIDFDTLIESGMLTVLNSRLSGGAIDHGGPVLNVSGTQISGDVWFRQQDNDALGTVEFSALDPLAEVQVLALDNLNQPEIPLGSVDFVLAANGAVVTSNEFVLTRDIDVIVLNAAPGTLTGVLFDQLQILTTGLAGDGRTFGRTQQLEDLLLPELFEDGVRGNVISLPLTMASAQ